MPNVKILPLITTNLLKFASDLALVGSIFPVDGTWLQLSKLKAAMPSIGLHSKHESLAL